LSVHSVGVELKVRPSGFATEAVSVEGRTTIRRALAMRAKMLHFAYGARMVGLLVRSTII
jgi:hypothetical protein